MGSSSSSGAGTFQVAVRQTVTLSDLPNCALAPAVNIIGATGCGTDIACVCKNSSFFSSLTTQLQAACSTVDFEKAIIVGDQLCAQAGVTIVSAYESADSTYVPVSALRPSSLTASASAMKTSGVSSLVSTSKISTPSTTLFAITVTSTLTGSVSVSTELEPGTSMASITATNVPSSSGTISSSPSLSSGAIAGIAVGGFVVALAILSLLFGSWSLPLDGGSSRQSPILLS